MIQVIFNRPTGKYKVPAWGFEFDATGWGWGNANGPGYGHDCMIAPGHYKLTTVDRFAPIPSEGSVQIHVEDLTDADVAVLVAAGKATRGEVPNLVVVIGEISAPIGGLAAYDRAAIMNHGGGSNASDPYAPYQCLCGTEGCTRLHNADVAKMADKITETAGSEHIVFTVVGDSPQPSC